MFGFISWLGWCFRVALGHLLDDDLEMFAEHPQRRLLAVAGHRHEGRDDVDVEQDPGLSGLHVQPQTGAIDGGHLFLGTINRVGVCNAGRPVDHEDDG